MTNSRVTYWGHAKRDFEAWDRQIAQAGGLRQVGPDHMPEGGIIIEPTLGPLHQKREAIRMLSHRQFNFILTASITATVGAQTVWIDGAVKLIGYDPLLVQAGGQKITVVGASPGERAVLEEMWPTYEFITIEDHVGHVFSREILPIINEAVDFLGRGLDPSDIDQAMQLGVNYPRGPLAYADLFGWENVYWGLRAMEDMYGPRFRPHPAIRGFIGSSLLEREEP